MVASIPSGVSIAKIPSSIPQNRISFNRIKSVLEIPDLNKVQLDSFDWLRREALKELFDEISPIRDFTEKKMELLFGEYYFRLPNYTSSETIEKLRNEVKREIFLESASLAEFKAIQQAAKSAHNLPEELKNFLLFSLKAPQEFMKKRLLDFIPPEKLNNHKNNIGDLIKELRQCLNLDKTLGKEARPGEKILKDLKDNIDGMLLIELLTPAELKHAEMECRQRDATFSAPLSVSVQLVVKETGEIKKQDIFLADFPWMTFRATFVVNGAERVVVSQLLRSPGVYFAMGKDLASGRVLCMTKLIPHKGAWLEFETTGKDVIFIKVDGKRKIPITTLLRALGYGSDKELLDMFEREDNLPEEGRKIAEHFYIKSTMDRSQEIYEKSRTLMERDSKIDEKTALENAALLDIYHRLRPTDPLNVDNARLLLANLFFNARRYDLGRVGRHKLNKRLGLNKREGELVIKALSENGIYSEIASLWEKKIIEEAQNKEEWQKYVKNVYAKVALKASFNDLINRNDEKVLLFIKALHEAVDSQHGEGFENIKLLCREAMENLEKRVLTRRDLVEIVKNIILVNKKGRELADDIDHLGNRRVRTVGELVQNALRVGLLRMERVVKERMSITDPAQATPGVLINIRPIVGTLREFFGASQLSQFMDQTNPLAELTHKRRLSALGPGGLSRERAGFDVRDVHHSHYGRVCPIETPEGPNIGLILSLATYSRVNDFGFIETPLRKVKAKVENRDGGLAGRIVRENIYDENKKLLIKAGGKITEKEARQLAKRPPFDIKVAPYVSQEIDYLTADKEEEHVIAQANIRLDDLGQFLADKVEVRKGEKYALESPEKVDYVDVSPKQIVGLTTSLIPFLEHNDANRALMGANMQRQAVPVIRPEVPVVATGMESIAARDSGQVLYCEREGEVISATSTEIIVRQKDGLERVYPLLKFLRTNQGTCINQRPKVNKGDHILPGQVLADSYATCEGELSLGQNILCAFMSWEGYNFEDAIVISERMVKEDKFTSIHMEKHEIEARDTKLGAEEITRDIPNVSEESLRNLDENGIIRIGAEVGPGDILVGKITPKGETELTAEDRLLRAIFGEKAKDVKDASLRVPHGESGRVIDVKVFSKKDELPSAGVNQLVKVWLALKRKISVGDKMAGRHGNKGVVARVLPEEDMPLLPDGRSTDILLNPIGVPSRMNIGQVFETHLGFASEILGMKVVSPVFDGAKGEDIEEALARVWIIQRSEAINYEISWDGKPSYDVEKVRAWLEERGYDREEVFNGGAKNVCLKLWLEDLGEVVPNTDEELNSCVERLSKEKKVLPPIYGKIFLRDGRTGEYFDQPVTVGNIYMMKLIHLVEDKIHARSIGPYSLITQQPLGGKAQFGGQRFGEMEVWALEAYGAAHILQELLTVKSDDINGRSKAYEAIIKGQDITQPGVPESFKVLTKELQSLGLSVSVLNEDDEAISLKDEEIFEGPRISGPLGQK